MKKIIEICLIIFFSLVIIFGGLNIASDYIFEIKYLGKTFYKFSMFFMLIGDILYLIYYLVFKKKSLKK